MHQYKYESPVTRYNMVEVKVPKRVLKQHIESSRNWFWSSPKVFVGIDGGYVIEWRLKWRAKAVALAMFPVYLIMDGFSNAKEIWKDVRADVMEETYGSFSCDSGHGKSEFWQVLVQYVKR